MNWLLGTDLKYMAAHGLTAMIPLHPNVTMSSGRWPIAAKNALTMKRDWATLRKWKAYGLITCPVFL